MNFYKLYKHMLRYLHRFAPKSFTYLLTYSFHQFYIFNNMIYSFLQIYRFNNMHWSHISTAMQYFHFTNLRILQSSNDLLRLDNSTRASIH